MTGGRQVANGRLSTYVAVGGTWYGPDDDIPEDVAAQITNPKAWAAEQDAGAGPNEVGEDKDLKAGTRSGARLARRVSVAGTWYGPEDPIPDDAAAKITNPKAWEGGKLPAGISPAGKDKEKPGDTGQSVDPPPRSGRGSGADAWATFAALYNVAVPEDANRDDIIANCFQAGVIEE